MIGLNLPQQRYLNARLGLSLTPSQWREVQRKATTPQEAMALAQAIAPSARARALPASFEAFFALHFGYRLHAQQVAIFDWFLSGLKKGVHHERQLLATRRIGKSDIVSIGAVAWTLLHDPTFKFIIVSKASANLRVINRKLREILDHYGVIERASLHDILVKGSSLRKEKSFSVRLLTAGANKRGLRADHIILDDLVDASDASALVREETLRVYSECRSIIPSTTLIGQLAHEADLPTQLRAREDVESYELWLPAVDASLREAIGLLDLQAVEQQYPKRYVGHNYTGYHYKDSTVQHFGDVAVGAFVGSGMVWAFVDPSFGGKDRTGITLISCEGDKIYAQVKESHADLSDLAQVMHLLAQLKGRGVHQVVVEANNGGDMLFKIPDVYAQAERLELSIESIYHTRAKIDRIMDLYPYRSRLVLSGDVECVRSWEKEISAPSAWGKERKRTAHDDGIDSLATGISYLAKRGFLWSALDAQESIALGDSDEWF